MRKILPPLIIVSLLALFVFIYFVPQIFITIRSGEGGVHFRRFFGGTVTDVVYGEGLQVIFPWDDLIVYNTRLQEKKIVLNVQSKEGLMVKLNVSVRYHPEYDLLGMLHKRIGKDYANVVVAPEVEAALRAHLGMLTADQLYTASDATMTEVVVKVVEEVTSNYVVINDVIIEAIELPPSVRASIDEKMRQMHIAESFTYIIKAASREAERKQIEADGYANYNATIDRSLSANILKWRGVEATKELAASPNAKVVVVGNGPGSMPLILGSDK